MDSGPSHRATPGGTRIDPNQRNATTLLQLSGLSAVFIAQPLLSRLSVNIPYLDTARLDPAAVWIVLAILLTVIPLTLYGALRLTAACHPGSARIALSLVTGIFFWIGCQLSLKWVSRRFQFLALGIPDVALLVFALFTAVVLTRIWRRNRGMRSFVTTMSWLALAVPVTFPFSGQMPSFLFPPAVKPHAPSVRFGQPVPIVIIQFDGLNSMALLDESLNLDAGRYPGFARLAAMSTWYANTTTVHYRTDNALPAMLTGRVPPGDKLPLASEYPGNLFELIHESQQYDETVFEPYTRLCPRELIPKPPQQPLAVQVSSLLTTLSLVFAATTMPDDVGMISVTIPRPWFGLPEQPLFDDSGRHGLLVYGWDRDRREQILHFRKCLFRTPRPWFRFLHVVAPHYPWRYTPSGRTYLHGLDASDYPPGTHGIIGEDWGPDELAANQAWQRYLMQLCWVDRMLSELLDQLEQQNMLHESLLIVAADHGVAFRAGITRRTPVAETIPDIAPIPLFIKLPGQTTGRQSHRNVEIIDVFPTLMDVLQIDSDVVCDGDSLLDESIPERPRKTMAGPDGEFVMEPDFPQRFEYTRRMTARFGSGPPGEQFYRLHTDPSLVGRRPEDFPLADHPNVRVEMYHRLDVECDTTDTVVPCLLRGTVECAEPLLPVELAIAVNGRIETTTRTFLDDVWRKEWAAMVRESAFRPGKNDVQIYQIRRDNGQVRLSLCELEP